MRPSTRRVHFRRCMVATVWGLLLFVVAVSAQPQAEWSYEDKAYLLVRECNKYTVKKKINDLQKVLMEGHQVLSEHEMLDFVSAFNYHVTNCKDDDTPALQSLACDEHSAQRANDLQEQLEDSGDIPIEDQQNILREISFLRLVCGSVRSVSCSAEREIEALSLSAQMDGTTREQARRRWNEVKQICKSKRD